MEQDELQRIPIVTHATIEDLTPDAFNSNRGTARGQQKLEQSLQEYGAGRSILLDKHGNIISGNHTTEAAAAIGLENVVIVQTTGEQIVAVQRMDLDLNEEGGTARKLAFADNRIAELNIDLDLQIVAEQLEQGINEIHLLNDLELQEMYATLQNDASFLDGFISGATSAPESASSAQEERAEASGVTAEADGITLATDPTAPSATPVDVVKLNFALPERLRNQITERLNAIKNENNYPTLAHALCHLLDIAYEA